MGTHRRTRLLPAQPFALLVTVLAVTLAVAMAPGTERSGVRQPVTRPAAATSPATYVIWPATPPRVATARSHAGRVVGTRFEVNAAGYISALRFYKSRGNRGPHVGTLSTADGQRLATVTYQHESARGWQTAAVSPPVAIQPGQTYVTAYRARHGRYSVSAKRFAGSRTVQNGPMTALGGAIGRHGLFPRTASRAAFYVDAVFQPNDAAATHGTVAMPADYDVPQPVAAPTLTGCAAHPSSCGYPDASNTGVPPGTVLRKSASVNADTPGQVIDGLDITGEINVTAPNVVIKNTRVTASSGDWIIIIRPGAANLTIQDSEIMSPAGATVDNACVFNISSEVPIMRRLNIHGCSAGVSSGGGLLEDSYIHDPGFTPGLSHITLVASNGGGGFTIRHNTVLNPYGQTAAVAFYQDFGVQRNDLIENNLLAGGGYVVYGGNGEKGTATNIRFLNNRFSRTFYKTGGYWGYVASFSPANSGNAWAGNYWDETLAAL
ncbi:MAG: hypothetical protein JWO46_3122 [Nocardioidaceae bacterium]|nr:hypothetical protein [Nocardioidaceae bacterium]